MIGLAKVLQKPKVQTSGARDRSAQKKNDCGRIKQNKRKMMVTVVIFFLLIAATTSIYYFIIPRMELGLKTSYHQGSLNSIFVNTKISNAGTIDLRDVSVNVSVYHLKSNNKAANKIENISVLKHWSEQEIKINFVGNQYDSYIIVISIHFKSNTKTFTRTFSHITNEEFMSQSFEDRIFEIGG
jgi:hypothetical protein